MNAITPSLREYGRLAAALEVRIAEEHSDDGVSDSLRSDLEAIWHQLTTDDQQTARGIHTDLRWVTGDPRLLGPPHEPNAARRLAEAVRSGDRLSALRHLRGLGGHEQELSQSELAYLRARLYEGLGLEEVASLLLDAASRLDPPNEELAFIAETACLAASGTSRATFLPEPPDVGGRQLARMAVELRRSLASQPHSGRHAETAREFVALGRRVRGTKLWPAALGLAALAARAGGNEQGTHVALAELLVALGDRADVRAFVEAVASSTQEASVDGATGLAA